MDDSFADAMRALERRTLSPADYGEPFVSVLPVTGAAVSTLGEVLGSETISATDERAARLDETQIDLGEGPCWDAIRLISPVAEPVFGERGRLRWPAFAAAVDGEAIKSIFAFPLSVGPLRLGAVDLYSLAGVAFTELETDRASAMAGAVGRTILRNALQEMGDDTLSVGRHSRRAVHQATGMVLAQLDIDADDALLTIQGYAFSSGRPVLEVADEILAGRLRFVFHNGRIETEE